MLQSLREITVQAKWLLTLLAMMATASSGQENEALSKEELAATLPGVEVQDINDTPIPGMYEVAVGPQVAYVSDDGRYFIQGDLYDLDSNQNLTEQRRARARVDVLAEIDPSTMIVFSPAPEDVTVSYTHLTLPTNREV